MQFLDENILIKEILDSNSKQIRNLWILKKVNGTELLYIYQDDDELWEELDIIDNS